jgi:hypothetical protein
MRNLKIIIISLIFYIVGLIIMWEMFRLWSWLFKSDFWRNIFDIITILGAMKYFWNHTDWTIKQFEKK